MDPDYSKWTCFNAPASKRISPFWIVSDFLFVNMILSLVISFEETEV
ncbi:MAG: hypothetical protein ACUVQ0_01335 [Thermoproteota archaeon]